MIFAELSKRTASFIRASTRACPPPSQLVCSGVVSITASRRSSRTNLVPVRRRMVRREIRDPRVRPRGRPFVGRVLGHIGALSGRQRGLPSWSAAVEASRSALPRLLRLRPRSTTRASPGCCWKSVERRLRLGLLPQRRGESFERRPSAAPSRLDVHVDHVPARDPRLLPVLRADAEHGRPPIDAIEPGTNGR